MKYLGAVLAAGLTFLAIVAIGIFSFLPAANVSQPSAAEAVAVEPAVDIPVTGQAVSPAAVDVAEIETNLAQRKAIYRSQISQLDQLLHGRRQTYQAQIELLGGQVGTAQDQLDTLLNQERALQGQVSELEALRTERLAAYQAQVEQAHSQYSPRLADLQDQLAQVQIRLVEANTQLGR